MSKTYLYQLRSAYPDPKHDNADAEYGLFTLDNAPKPVATAIHNLTTILASPEIAAAPVALSPLAYSLGGMPADAHSVLLREPGGVAALVVWAEPVIWDEGAHRTTTPPTAKVTVSLAAAASSVRVFDPLAGIAPTQTTRDAGTVQIALTDHPVIIEITPR